MSFGYLDRADRLSPPTEGHRLLRNHRESAELDRGRGRFPFKEEVMGSNPLQSVTVMCRDIGDDVSGHRRHHADCRW